MTLRPNAHFSFLNILTTNTMHIKTLFCTLNTKKYFCDRKITTKKASNNKQQTTSPPPPTTKKLEIRKEKEKKICKPSNTIFYFISNSHIVILLNKIVMMDGNLSSVYNHFFRKTPNFP